jgi:hypothetical protein
MDDQTEGLRLSGRLAGHGVPAVFQDQPECQELLCGVEREQQGAALNLSQEVPMKMNITQRPAQDDYHAQLIAQGMENAGADVFSVTNDARERLGAYSLSMRDHFFIIKYSLMRCGAQFFSLL